MDYNELIEAVRKLAGEVGEAQLMSAVMDVSGVQHNFGDAGQGKVIIIGGGQRQLLTMQFDGKGRYIEETRVTEAESTDRRTS